MNAKLLIPLCAAVALLAACKPREDTTAPANDAANAPSTTAPAETPPPADSAAPPPSETPPPADTPPPSDTPPPNPPPSGGQ
jgi:type VI secretion system secreted protein VgrG